MLSCTRMLRAVESGPAWSTSNVLQRGRNGLCCLRRIDVMLTFGALIVRHGPLVQLEEHVRSLTCRYELAACSVSSTVEPHRLTPAKSRGEDMREDTAVDDVVDDAHHAQPRGPQAECLVSVYAVIASSSRRATELPRPMTNSFRTLDGPSLTA